MADSEEDYGAMSVEQLRDKKYSIVRMKMIGGFVKFFCEDCFQFSIQGAYLIKMFHHMSKSARYFTMASMTSSLIMSFVGPIHEFLKARAMRKKREGMRVIDDADPETQDKELLNMGLEAQKEQRASTCVLKSKPRLVLSQADPEVFLKAHREHAVFANRALQLSALLFWGGMAGIPVIFQDRLTCGCDIPTSCFMYFFILASCGNLAELYVMVHIEDGVRFIMNFVERIRGRHNIIFTLAGLFSYVGKFDTFSDIITTILLTQCPPIHWVSIKGVVINIPFFSLGHWAIITLVIGVIFCQALPGLYMVHSGTYVPLGLKLNEFTTLLAILDEGLEPGLEELDDGHEAEGDNAGGEYTRTEAA